MNRKLHTVRPGDSASSIAALHGITLPQLMQANPTKPRMIAMVGGRPAEVFASLAPGEVVSVDCGCTGGR